MLAELSSMLFVILIEASELHCRAALVSEPPAPHPSAQAQHHTSRNESTSEGRAELKFRTERRWSPSLMTRFKGDALSANDKLTGYPSVPLESFVTLRCRNNFSRDRHVADISAQQQSTRCLDSVIARLQSTPTMMLDAPTLSPRVQPWSASRRRPITCGPVGGDPAPPTGRSRLVG